MLWIEMKWTNCSFLEINFVAKLNNKKKFKVLPVGPNHALISVLESKSPLAK
jgi:hypothetical protein